MDTIVVENLVKRFEDVTAVNNVSFTVKRGRYLLSLDPMGQEKQPP